MRLNSGVATPHPIPLPMGEGALARFTDSAARLAGMAGALLGWRPDEFWSATPAELATVAAALAGETDAAGAGELALLMEMYPDG